MDGSQETRRSLGVAVWGIGSHAIKTVLPELAVNSDVDIVGLHSRNTVTCQAQAAHYGCCVFSDPEVMLSSPDVDVVYLATPTSLHFEHAKAVLGAGKHLWCEKPMTTTLSDAEALKALAETQDVLLAVVCAPKYHPHFQAVRDQFNDAGIGTPKHFDAVFQFPHLDQTNFRYDPDLGGGALLDVGFYLFDVVDALCPYALESFTCDIKTEEGFRVDTSGTALLTYANGVTASLRWGYGGAYENAISIEGDQGRVLAEPFFSKPANRSPSVCVTGLDGAIRHIDFENARPFRHMIQAFANAVHDPDLRGKLIESGVHAQHLLEQAKMKGS